MKEFYFKGISSASFGLRVGGVDNYGAPGRRYTEYLIPGANGTKIVDSGCFEAYPREYAVALPNDPHVESTMSAIKAWLLGEGGDFRLEDSYAPDVYRMAHLASGIETELMGASGRSVKFGLNFICQPEKWLKSGERAILIEDDGYAWLHNPTGMETYPQIIVHSTNGCTIEFVRPELNGVTHDPYCVIEVSQPFSDLPIVIDGQTTEAWMQGSGLSANTWVEFQGRPLLNKEPAIVRLVDAAGASIEVIPRWWRL